MDKKKNTYIIIDTSNLFFRCQFLTNGDIDTKIGMAFHVMFNSLRKVWNMYDGTHVLFTTEGKSWRYAIEPKYKIQRKLDRASKTVAEQEEGAIMMEALNDLQTFIDEKTNCTLVRAPKTEADDVIAVFVQDHPEDNHVIVSSDSDFVQLLADNVIIHDGVMDRTLKKDGVYNGKGKKVEFTVKSDSKIKSGAVNPNFVPEREDWYTYSLFLKCIRGDKSDSIFGAYPGARIKGTKNKVGINEAYDDRIEQGFTYNNFMLQRWTDHEGVEHRVGDVYEKNRLLIDLTMHPDDVREDTQQCINNALVKEPVRNVGIHFLKFCTRWDLAKLSQWPEDFARILNAKYNSQ